MKFFYEFNPVDGVFTGRSMCIPDAMVSMNVMPGMDAIASDERIDPRRSAVAVDATGSRVVVRRLPDRPVDTDLVTWVLDAATEDWVAQPTLTAHRAALRAARNDSLSASDGPAIAAMEALVVAMADRLQVPVPSATHTLVALRQSLRDLPLSPEFDALSVGDVPRYAGSTGSTG